MYVIDIYLLILLTYTHTLTDTNRFYNLSHAVCYRYGTDNKY